MTYLPMGLELVINGSRICHEKQLLHWRSLHYLFQRRCYPRKRLIVPCMQLLHPTHSVTSAGVHDTMARAMGLHACNLLRWQSLHCHFPGKMLSEHAAHSTLCATPAPHQQHHISKFSRHSGKRIYHATVSSFIGSPCTTSSKEDSNRASGP